VFLKLPLEHPQNGSSTLVCKLHKSIYGLKQSSRAWHAKLSVAPKDFVLQEARGVQKNRITEKTEKTDGKLTEKTEPK